MIYGNLNSCQWALPTWVNEGLPRNNHTETAEDNGRGRAALQAEVTHVKLSAFHDALHAEIKAQASLGFYSRSTAGGAQPSRAARRDHA